MRIFCVKRARLLFGAWFLIGTALIYPIEAHWIWDGDWLAQLGCDVLQGRE